MAVSSNHIFFFFFFSFSILMAITLARHSAPVVGQCLDDQKKLLLALKSEIKLNVSQSISTVTWNETDDDCCHWKGIVCDDAGHVISLRLPYEGISGGIGESSSLFRLTYMSQLELSFNDFTTSHIPNQFHRLPHLTYLDLSDAGFIGSIPSTLSNLTELVSLDLSGNSLTGSLPSFLMCKHLVNIHVQDNNLIGSLSHLHFQALTNLFYLDLSHNLLNSTIPHHLFTLPSITTLDLSFNQFSGQIEEIPNVNHSYLGFLDLSSNRLQGYIPDFFFQFPSLSYLWLCNNLFNGTFNLHKVQSLPVIEQLCLSDNNLSVETTNMDSSSGQFITLYLSSCNLYEFPDLRNQSSLSDLDLSNNYIGGNIPSWVWDLEIQALNLSLNLLTGFQKPYHMPTYFQFLDLHSNQLRGELPFPIIPPHSDSQKVDRYSFDYVLLSNNSLTGVISTSLCNSSEFWVLDLSFNNLSGRIPACLLEKDLVRDVLNLRGNNINGVIPDQFSSECTLKTFDVSDNNLGGKIPKSVANCKSLKVMNIGNNNFDDSFPCMLPLSLHILVLRSNSFHGVFRCHKSWPELQILDISSNNFSGTLNPLNFSNWRGMILESPGHLGPSRSNSSFLRSGELYRDEVTLTVKGIELKLVKIWPDFTSIDLSSNNFEGEIPDAIGSLTSLYLLNLSHNALTNTIPKSLGALTELGALDLSTNQLRGRIPSELAKLTFLSVLNVSYNHLTGVIPTGSQFQTFSANSFEGNTGLCGFPLEKSCSCTPRSGAAPSESKDEEEIEWEYVFAAFGYVVGLGSIAWTLLCCRSFRERYFEKIEDVGDNIFFEPGRRRRHARRVEMRNELLRRRRQRQRG